MNYYNPTQIYLSDIDTFNNDKYCDITFKINGIALLSQIIIMFDSFEHEEVKISNTGYLNTTTKPEHARDIIKSILNAISIVKEYSSFYSAYENDLKELLNKLYRLFPDL